MSLSANSLNVAAITAALKDSSIGHTIDYRQQVSSTMTLARQLAADPMIASGTVVVADEQTAGRGRGGRRWQVPSGEGLLLSLLIKAPIPVALSQIPMLAGLAASAAIVAHQPILAGKVGLKWPNDLLLGSGRQDAYHEACKVGGILVESSFYGPTLAYVIIGMGINLFQDPATLPMTPPGAPAPTSLAHFLAAHAASPAAAPAGEAGILRADIVGALDRTALLIALCRAWAAHLDPVPAPHQTLERWRAALWTLGQNVVIQATVPDGASVAHQPGRVDTVSVLHGKAVDVTAAGELIVTDAAGNLHQFAAGDVSVRMG